MTPFKIGQFVLMDTMIGVSRPARVEAISPGRRARLIMLDTGERLEDVALGNIAAAGEDRDTAARERSAMAWATGPVGRGYAGDGNGNFRATAVSGDAPIETDHGANASYDGASNQ